MHSPGWPDTGLPTHARLGLLQRQHDLGGIIARSLGGVMQELPPHLALSCTFRTLILHWQACA